MSPCTASGLLAAYMRLLRHERCHLEQIERDGRLLFSVKYLWWLFLIPAPFGLCAVSSGN